MVFIVLGAIKAAQVARREMKKDTIRHDVITPVEGSASQHAQLGRSDWWDKNNPPPSDSPEQQQVATSESQDENLIRHANPNVIGAWSREAPKQQSSPSYSTTTAATTQDILALPAPPTSSSSSRDGSIVSTSSVHSTRPSPTDNKSTSRNNISASTSLSVVPSPPISNNNEAAPIVSLSSISSPPSPTSKPNESTDTWNLQPVTTSHKVQSNQSSDLSLPNVSQLSLPQSALTRTDTRKRHTRQNATQTKMNTSIDDNMKSLVPISNTNPEGPSTSSSCMQKKGSMRKRIQRGSNEALPRPAIKTSTDSMLQQSQSPSEVAQSCLTAPGGARKKRLANPNAPLQRTQRTPSDMLATRSLQNSSDAAQSCMATAGSLKKRSSQIQRNY